MFNSARQNLTPLTCRVSNRQTPSTASTRRCVRVSSRAGPHTIPCHEFCQKPDADFSLANRGDSVSTRNCRGNPGYRATKAWKRRNVDEHVKPLDGIQLV